MDPWSIGIGLGLTAAGTILGKSDADKTEAAQRGILGQGVGENEKGRLAGQAGYNLATPYMDQMLEASESLEGDLLASIDPITSREVRRITQERQYSQGIVNQEMSQRGLDSFTTRMGAQSNAQGQASNAMVELQARMAGVRSSAITQGRSAYIQGLGARSQFEVNRGQANSEGYYRNAALYGNTQIVGPTTAADIGSLAGSAASFHRTSVLEQSLQDSAPT